MSAYRRKTKVEKIEKAQKELYEIICYVKDNLQAEKTTHYHLNNLMRRIGFLRRWLNMGKMK